LGGDFENAMHQNNLRKGKQVGDVPVMECQDAETEREGGTDVERGIFRNAPTLISRLGLERDVGLHIEADL
jgi:hypothetical protein